MKLFIQVAFWLGTFVTIIRLLEMSLRTWPKKTETTLGMHTTITIIGIGTTVWAGILLFT